MTDDWRSEPPDEAGWWDWRRSPTWPAERLHIAFRHGAWRQRISGNWFALPQGGQWRRVPQ